VLAPLVRCAHVGGSAAERVKSRHPDWVNAKPHSHLL
jgi:hypothetical protein